MRVAPAEERIGKRVIEKEAELEQISQAIKQGLNCGLPMCEHRTELDCLKAAVLPVISSLLDAAKREAFSEAADSADVQEVVVEKLGAISKDAIAGIRDAAHADALRAAAEFLRCKCGMDCGFMDCTVGPNDILALIPERARLERELEVARAQEEILNLADMGCFEAHDPERCGPCKAWHKVRTDKADLEAKLAALIESR